MSIRTGSGLRLAIVIGLACVALAPAYAATLPEILYEEDFAGPSLNSTTAVDHDEPTNVWYATNDCIETTLPGHTARAVARWGNPDSCADYGGPQTHVDTLTTELIDVSSCPASIVLEVNYYIDYEHFLDGAQVTIWPDGGPPSEVVANAYHIGGLYNVAEWRTLTVDLSQILSGYSSVEVDFRAITDFGGAGVGFLVDDIVIKCVATNEELYDRIVAVEDETEAIRTETDKISMVKFQTDKIPLIQAETDKIPLIQTETDKIQDILDRLEELEGVNDDRAIEHALLTKKPLPWVCLPETFGGRLERAGELALAAYENVVASGATPRVLTLEKILEGDAARDAGDWLVACELYAEGMRRAMGLADNAPGGEM